MKVTRKSLFVFIIVIVSALAGYQYRVYSEGGATPTIDPDVGVYDFPWLNATTGVNAPEFYLKGENKTDLLAFPELGASYVIFKEGSTIYAKNCSSGLIDQQGNDISTIINSISDGKYIHIRSGVYDSSNKFTLSQNQILQGSGRDTIIDFGVTDSGDLIELSIGAQLINIKITGSISLSHSKQYIDPLGDNYISNIFVDTMTNGIIISSGAQNISIENCLFNNIKNTDNWGAAINSYGGKNIYIRDIEVHDSNRGIEIEKGSEGIFVEHILLNNITDTVLDVHTHNGEGTTRNVIFRDIYLINTGLPSIYGVDSDDNVENILIDGIYIINSKNGNIPIRGNHITLKNWHLLNIQTSSSEYTFVIGGTPIANNIILENIKIENAIGKRSLYITSTSKHITVRNFVVYPHESTPVSEALYFQGEFLSVFDCKIEGTTGWSTAFYIRDCKNSLFQHNYVFNKTFYIHSTVSNSSFLDNYSPTWSITIGDNSFYRNINFITESSGTSTINSGTTSVTINHELSYTPTAEDISVVFTENPTNDIGIWWISGVTSTQFVINVRSDPGESNLDLSWIARMH